MSSPTQRDRRSDAGHPRLSFEAAFWRRVEKTAGCWIWTGPLRPNGYGQVTRNGRNLGAHRVAYELVVGPIATGRMIRHRCDNRQCVRPEHLEQGTNTENLRDMVDRGRSLKGDRNPVRPDPSRVRRGEQHPAAKLTRDGVESIRSLYAAGGTSYQRLARQFGVSKRRIQLVVSGRAWS